jgi:hypothetical protein
VFRSAAFRGLLVALGLLLVAATGAAARSGSVYGPEAANRALAGRQALMLLRHLRPPAGAQRIGRHRTRGRLSADPVDGRQPRLRDAHSFWLTDRSPGAALRFVAHHLPHGLQLSTRAAGDSSSGVGSLSWQLRPLPGLESRAIAVSAVALSRGVTGVRLDGEAQWLAPRARWDRVPPGVARATVSGHGAVGIDRQAAGPQSRVTVLSPSRAQRLAGWINRQPIAQPGGFYTCPFGSNQVLSVQFLGDGGGVLAQSDESFPGGCPALSLTVEGRIGPPLQDGGLEDELVRLHVIAPCRQDELSSPTPMRGRASGEPALTFTLRDVSREICTIPQLGSIVLLGRGHRVLVGHDLQSPPGPPNVLYPATAESITGEFQNCANRPAARIARVRLAGQRGWTVALPPGPPIRPCAEPLTVVPDG